MLISIIKILLAVGVIILGAYLSGLAYSTQLGSPLMNNVVFISGILMSGGAVTYLLIMWINRLTK